MKRKVVTQVFAGMMAFFLLCCGVFVTAYYRYASRTYSAQLREEVLCSAAAMEAAGGDTLPAIGGAITARVTHIAPDGRVLYDSDNDPTTMSNHAERTEVKEALATGFGEESRYSEATGKTVLYVAMRLTDGSVLRVAAPAYGVRELLLTLFTPLLIALLLALTLALLLALRVSRSVLRPIAALDLSGNDERDVYPELRPLVRRINTQNRQIRRQMEELKAEHERQDNLRREFTANVSHELKTPLTTIAGSAELLRDGLVRQEDVPTFGERIYGECHRLISLVGDIIKLSRLESRLSPPEKATVDLHELCETVLSHLDPAAARREVTLSLQGGPVTVFGAESILYEMVYNLCDNAIQYNRPGGSVALILAREAQAIRLTVKDTGIGIPAADMERVFERFYRVDKSHSREVGGTGLGLSIVKHGAAFHGARVAVQSTLDEGSEFTVYFPLKQAEQSLHTEVENV